MARAGSSAEQQIRVPVSSGGFDPRSLCDLEGHGAMILSLNHAGRRPEPLSATGLD